MAILQLWHIRQRLWGYWGLHLMSERRRGRQTKKSDSLSMANITFHILRGLEANELSRQKIRSPEKINYGRQSMKSYILA